MYINPVANNVMSECHIYDIIFITWFWKSDFVNHTQPQCQSPPTPPPPPIKKSGCALCKPEENYMYSAEVKFECKSESTVSETNLRKVSACCGRLRRLALSKKPFTQIYETRRIRNKLSSSRSLSIHKKKINVLNHISAIQTARRQKIRKLLKMLPPIKK